MDDDFNKFIMDTVGKDLGWHSRNMLRDRPYGGQEHTDTGIRGATEIKGVTFRDLRDCFIRAALLSSSHLFPDGPPSYYDEAKKGEHAALCEQDLYGWDWDKIDPMALFQNLSCEVERLMGIYPNVQMDEDKGEG